MIGSCQIANCNKVTFYCINIIVINRRRSSFNLTILTPTIHSINKFYINT